MTGDGWAASAADCLGWSPVRVEPLTGTEATGVVRVRSAGATAVLKRFDRADFEAARLVGCLPGAPFAPVIGESAERSVLAFADLGPGKPIPPDPAGRRAAAIGYVEAVSHAISALAAFGLPPPVSAAVSLNGFLGFVPLTPAARVLRTPSEQLAAIAASSRPQSPPVPALASARRADRELAAALTPRQGHRRWILRDANPSNLIVRDGPPVWVDVLPAAGLPEANLLALPGSHFRLDEPSMLEVLRAAGHRPERDLLRTLNGLFSVLTLCDTAVGLADGSRNGLVHSGLDYRANERFSLGLAAELLAGGLPAATGYLPMVEWLAGTGCVPPGGAP